jgi:hypothetical protein
MHDYGRICPRSQVPRGFLMAWTVAALSVRTIRVLARKEKETG